MSMSKKSIEALASKFSSIAFEEYGRPTINPAVEALIAGLLDKSISAAPLFQSIPMYSPGDVVEWMSTVKGKKVRTGRTAIIADVTVDDGRISYATAESAWHTHDDFVLVHKATAESLSRLQEIRNGDDDEELEEEDE